MNSRSAIVMGSLLTGLALVFSSSSEAGELRGRFEAAAADHQAVVWIEGVSGAPVPKKDTVISHTSGRFEPFVSIGFVGNDFVLRNEENRLHNTHLSLRLAYQEAASERPLHYGATLYNIALPKAGAEVRRPIKPYHRYRDETGFIEVICNPHPEEEAFVLVFDHPYAAITGKDGEFTIPNLPPGMHEVRYWHVGVIHVWQTVEIDQDGVAEIIIKPE